MTMFSMKPQFNLAEFLAEPAKPKGARPRGRMNFSSRPKPPAEPADPAAQPDAAEAPAESGAPDATETP